MGARGPTAGRRGRLGVSGTQNPSVAHAAPPRVQGPGQLPAGKAGCWVWCRRVWQWIGTEPGHRTTIAFSSALRGHSLTPPAASGTKSPFPAWLCGRPGLNILPAGPQPRLRTRRLLTPIVLPALGSCGFAQTVLCVDGHSVPPDGHLLEHPGPLQPPGLWERSQPRRELVSRPHSGRLLAHAQARLRVLADEPGCGGSAAPTAGGHLWRRPPRRPPQCHSGVVFMDCGQLGWQRPRHLRPPGWMVPISAARSSESCRIPGSCLRP